MVATATTGHLLDSLFAGSVIDLPFLRIAQRLNTLETRDSNFIGSAEVLEPLMGLLIPLMLVRMELLGQLSVRLLDLIGICVPRHAEDLNRYIMII